MKSLQSRVLTAVFGVTLAVVAAIVLLVNGTVERMVVEKENAHAQETLDLALMTIRGENRSYQFHRQALLEERRQALKSLVENGLAAITHAHNLFLAGNMTEEGAQRLALETVRQMRYAGGSGYLWIQDCTLPIPNMLMHPAIPEVEGGPGSDQRFYEALDGSTNLLTEFVGRTAEGPAYVTYRWPKPTPEGLTSMQPKISYVSRFLPWGWLVGTGLYIDDIEQTCDQNRRDMTANTMRLLKEVRLMESGYLYIFDSQGIILLHPSLPVGENVMHLENPETGTSLFQDIMDAAHTPAGRLQYLWNKPGVPAERLFQKIAYVRYFEPLDWYIAASIYEDELHAPARALSGKILWVSTGLLLVAVIVCSGLVRSIVKPLSRLADSAQHIQAAGFDTLDSQELRVNGPEEVRTLGLRLHQLLKSLRQEQEQLRQSQKMEALGSLAGGVAHDFNNMLAGIMGAAELLDETLAEQDADLKEYLALIMDSAQHAAELAKQLLAFSRKQAVTFTPVSIHEVLCATIDILSKTIDKRIVIEARLNAEDYTVMGDPSQLQSVFLNMGINAAHAMPEGGRLTFETTVFHVDDTRRVSGSTDLSSGPHIDVAVCDTGHGITPENLGRIFEPFYTTKPLGRGTGLGLAAAYGTIQQHHGSISVSSEVGSGSTFHVVLPLTDVAVAEESPTIQEHQGGGTILLVDDEEAVRITQNAILTKYGYNVLTAENGEEAVELYRTRHNEIDLVICDMIMPRMNGRDCFAALSQINPQVRFILSSGFIEQQDTIEMEEQGLAGYIKKPFRAVDLIQIVQRVLAN